MFLRFRPFIITVATILIAFALYYPFSPGGVQSRNMAKARAHIPIVQRAIGSSPTFANIQLTDFTAGEGSLLVKGTVPTRADIDQLKKIVASTSPPTVVLYHVLAEDEMSVPQTVPTSR
jgi:hypothetical protein